jgi:hypothetical protein
MRSYQLTPDHRRQPTERYHSQRSNKTRVANSNRISGAEDHRFDRPDKEWGRDAVARSLIRFAQKVAGDDSFLWSSSQRLSALTTIEYDTVASLDWTCLLRIALLSLLRLQIG